jgi:site-specific recombinase XerD
LNSYAKLLEETIKERETVNKPLTQQYLKDTFDKVYKHKKVTEITENVVTALQQFIDAKNLSENQSDNWNEKYKNLKAKLEYFENHKGHTITFTDFDADLLNEYCGFLRTIKNDRFSPHNDNTLHRHINFLITFLIWSKGKYHNNENLRNPVKKYQPDDVHLTTMEVQKLENITLKTRHLQKVRDIFLIGVYSGQRFSDYSVFEKADLQGDVIIKRAEKTEYESIIPLHPKLKALLDKYDWKIPTISSQKFNIAIQNICLKCEMTELIKETIYAGNKKEVRYQPKYKMVASHTARRTFITLSSERGMPDHVIMKITGIRDPKTLQKYKKTSQSSIVESMNKYWN